VNGAERFATFVVRVAFDDSGEVTGVLICVRSGERTAFWGVDQAGVVLRRAIEKEIRGSAASAP